MSGPTIDETILIAAPPETVWKLLADPRSWRHWWPGCLDAETKDRKTLHDGSEIALRLRFGWLVVPLRPRVDAATPPKSLVWTGRGFGVAGRHAFYLEAKPSGTFVRQQETFHGPAAALYRLLGLERLTRKMFRANLRGLKRFAEQKI